MTIAWGSKAAQECWDGVRRDIAKATDRMWNDRERGKQPCAKSSSGDHDWRRRPSSVMRGYGWDECANCKATRD